ncbi:MAG: aldo/keto reductase [Clostridia bacterium]|nr:aldo/keto reductase [Clostridia bacterium]
MQYRKMPKSEDKLSVLGYGCMRLPTKGSSIDAEEAKRQVLHAIEGGVNYLDTAWPYHRGASESFLGEHILNDKAVREKVYVATKLPCFTISKSEKFDEIFNKQLSKLNIDYVDYYLLHSLSGSTWQKMVDLGIKEWMDKIKKEGKVRHMGFSFHGKQEDFFKIVDGYDFDFCQVQFNILDENYQAGIKGIEYAADKGLGIIVMEPLRGGSLTDKIPEEIQKIYDTAEIKRKPADWALRWIYNHPQVTLLLSGMNKMEHIDENIKVASESMPGAMNEKENKIIADVRNKYLELLTIGCTGCGYCMPCPVGIDIPGVLKELNNYHMFSKAGAKLKYIAYNGIMTADGNAHYASSCIECGKCEKKCPQNLEIRNAMKQIGKEMESPLLKLMGAAARPIINRGRKK